MKVNVYQTVEVSDEQRVMLANLIDGEVSKPKRQATREEIKEFVWESGADWEVELTDLWTQRFEEGSDNEFDMNEIEERAARAAELAARVEAATEDEADDEDLDAESLI